MTAKKWVKHAWQRPQAPWALKAWQVKNKAENEAVEKRHRAEAKRKKP